jgi:hypothetical protein
VGTTTGSVGVLAGDAGGRLLAGLPPGSVRFPSSPRPGATELVSGLVGGGISGFDRAGGEGTLPAGGSLGLGTMATGVAEGVGGFAVLDASAGLDSLVGLLTSAGEGGFTGAGTVDAVGGGVIAGGGGGKIGEGLVGGGGGMVPGV